MDYCVYILTNASGTLYIGVTNDLARRLTEHKGKAVDSFTRRYNVNLLVYHETTNDVWAALEREKQLKKWRRAKKVALIESVNPLWRDLSEDVLGPRGSR